MTSVPELATIETTYKGINMTETTPKIFPAMAQCIVDIGLLGIDKTSNNSFQKFNYRSVDQVLSAFNKVFSKNGIFMVHRTLDSKKEIIGQDSKGTNIWGISFDLEVQFYAVDGSCLPQPALISGMNDGKDASKLTGQLTSYLLKELLFKMFVVPTEGAEDIDGRDEKGRPSSVVDLPNSKGIAWSEPNLKLGLDATLAWAASVTGKTLDEVKEIFENTIPDSNGSRGLAFYKEIKRIWKNT